MNSSATNPATSPIAPATGAPTPQALAAALGLHPPTPEQARVIAHPLTPLLVVAGAGSGKTATMSQRVVHLVARGEVTADQVLGLTFTRKATAELAQRVTARLGSLAASGLVEEAEDVLEPTISTYNAFAGSLVRDHGLRIGIDPDSVLITEARAWQIVTDLLQSRRQPLPVDRPSTAARIVLDLDAALSENLLEIEQAAEDLEALADLFEGLSAVRGLKTSFARAGETASQRLGMLQVVADYRAHKHRNALLSFGDQIALACRIAEEVPEAAAQVRAQYPAVLLDEFQDTSVAQVRLLSALFAGGGVTAVGDPNQAIYGWRGASAGALDAFHPRFNPAGTATVRSGEVSADDPAGAPVLPLSTAWRNDRAVLAAANAVSEPLRRHVPHPGDAPATRVPVAELRPRPDDAGLADGRVLGTVVADPLAQAEAVADFMAEHWGPTAELAVLGRVRSAFPVIAEALEARGIPCEIIGLGGMLTVPEVADVRALMTVAADPERGDRLMRLLTAARIGAADLRALSEYARALVRRVPAMRGSKAERDEEGAPLLAEAIEAVARSADAAPGGIDDVDVPGLTREGARAADRVARAVRRVRAVLTLPPAEAVIAAEQALNLDIELASRVGDRLGRRALDALRTTAEQYTADMEAPTVADFLTWLDAAVEHERGLETPEVAPEPGAVQILTVHAAKGLEWDHVAVVGLAEGVFPSYSTTPVADLSVKDWSWMTRLDEFPHPLRADTATLPPFELGALEPPAVDKDEAKDLLLTYRLALGRYGVAEERRLAYVAITRARHEVLLVASHFVGEGSRPRPESRFLTELRRRGLVEPWGEGFTELDPDAVNRLATRTVTAQWPEPAADDDLARARAAAARAVAEEARSLPAAGRAPDTGPGTDEGDPVVSRWRQEAALLLAEREELHNAAPTVRMPAHLPATKLDDLRADPEAFALDLRRPLPPEPRTTGRLGTVFHEAIAQRLTGQGQLLSLAEAGAPQNLGDQDRQTLQQWLETAETLPFLEGCALRGTEVELELTLAATTLRCRLDAVFRAPDGAWLIVDWKTGQRRVPVDQLSVYVHALAASRGVRTGSVRAAYVYVGLPDHPRGLVDELGEADLLPLSEIEASLAVTGGLDAGPDPGRS